MKFRFIAEDNSSIYEAFHASFSSAPCGGNGTCGKCRVRVVPDDPSAMPSPAPEDYRLLSPSEISSGIRLACRCRPTHSCTVFLSDGESGFRVVSSYRVPPWRIDTDFPAGERFGVAVDIGTTTIAMELVDLSDGTVIASDSFLNAQRPFGADIFSRIRAASEGAADELRSAVGSGLSDSFARLFTAVPSVEPSRVRSITMAANVTMIHLLLGLPCAALGVAPFTPVSLSFPDLRLADVITAPDYAGVSPECPVRIVPALGTFVGGDIVSGLAVLGLPDSSRSAFFIDLGTNAEMALISGGRLWCASAASGPAFEGGSISCGTGSVSGAVSSVFLEGNHFGYTVIGPDGEARRPDATLPATGVCGSGLVDFVACALDAGLVLRDGSVVQACAESGILLDPVGTIRLLPSDIREFQLAKAAIRAGISVLLSTAGMSAADVSRVYVAGGFGLYLQEASALRTGLFPREFAARIEPVGNTSLAGATRYLADPSMESRFDSVMRSACVIELANDSAFSKFFIDAMEFD